MTIRLYLLIGTFLVVGYANASNSDDKIRFDEIRKYEALSNISCGIWSAYFASLFFGINAELRHIQDGIPLKEDGTSELFSVKRYLDSQGITVVPVSCELEELKSSQAFIAVLNESDSSSVNHFAFGYWDKSVEKFKFADPQRSETVLIISFEKLSKEFRGKALLLSKSIAVSAPK